LSDHRLPAPASARLSGIFISPASWRTRCLARGFRMAADFRVKECEFFEFYTARILRRTPTGCWQIFRRHGLGGWLTGGHESPGVVCGRPPYYPNVAGRQKISLAAVSARSGWRGRRCVGERPLLGSEVAPNGPDSNIAPAVICNHPSFPGDALQLAWRPDVVLTVAPAFSCAHPAGPLDCVAVSRQALAASSGTSKWTVAFRMGL